MMHVAMIGPAPAHWGGLKRHGGVATHVQGLVPLLPDLGVEVRLLADNTDVARPVPLPNLPVGVRVQRMARSPRALVGLGLGRIARIAWKMLADPSLRQAAPLSYQIKFLGQAANFDEFLARQTPDLLHVHHAEYRAYLCRRVIETQIPLVATAHSASALLQPERQWLIRLVQDNYRFIDWIIPVSNYVKEVIIEHGADPNRMTVIPNGVDPDTFRPYDPSAARNKLGLPSKGVIVLFTGSLIPVKGVDVLLKALAQCGQKNSEMLFVLVGGGAERNNLEEFARELGIAGQVIFAGRKPLTEMPLWYQSCDIFVMPSWSEGLSVSILEAMASGKPVITTFPERGTHDAIIEGQTGSLVRAGDVGQLARALERLAQDPALRHRLGANARQRAKSDFAWEVVARKTVEVYRETLARVKGKA